MISSLLNLLHKQRQSLLKIVRIHKPLIINYKRVLKEIIKLKPLRTPIHIIHHMSLNPVCVLRPEGELPLEFQFLFLSQLLLQVVGSSGKDEVVESHLFEEGSLVG